MKIIQPGDLLQIKGSLGFLMNPIVKVVDVQGNQENGIATIITKDDTDGLLGFTNVSKIGLYTLRSKI